MNFKKQFFVLVSLMILTMHISYAQSKSTSPDYRVEVSHTWDMFNYIFDYYGGGLEIQKYSYPIIHDTATYFYDFEADMLYRPEIKGVGAVLDFSKSQQAPLSIATLSFKLDTVIIEGNYTRVNDVTDTLFLEVVYSSKDTSKANTEFMPMKEAGTPDIVAILAPRYDPAPINALSGLTRKVYSLYLTNADTVVAGKENKNLYFKIALEGGSGLSIPANNIVGAYITFKPGSTYELNDTSFVLPNDPTNKQTVNSFSPNYLIPTVNMDNTTANDINDVFLDRESYGLTFQKDHKGYDTLAYAINWNKVLMPQLHRAYLISFVVSGDYKTGISDNAVSNNRITVYPNPTADVISISTSTKSTVDFKLYDITGKCMVNKSNQTINGTLQINVSNLPNGIYFYNLLIDGKENLSNKIIINN